MTEVANEQSRPPIEITDKALAKLVELIAKKPEAGMIRIGVKAGGCSGLAYSMTYADKAEASDEEIKLSGVTILVDKRVLMYLAGSKMDYAEEQFRSGFVFTNPQEKSRCGCGKSFGV